jgi:hypothetical protein
MIFYALNLHEQEKISEIYYDLLQLELRAYTLGVVPLDYILRVPAG